MRIFIFFDLPTKTNLEKKFYREFRKTLLQNGFFQLQYSIYVRYCYSMDETEKYTKRLHGCLPPEGEIRLLILSDLQFDRMHVLLGKKSKQEFLLSEPLVIF